jgi:hypothetical protein
MTTTHLGLNELVASQSQPHIPINMSLRKLDALVQLSVLEQTATPPGSPAEGDRYVVGASATGDWSGHDDNVAAFIGGAWTFFTPVPGWIVYDQSLSAIYVFKSGSPDAWEELQPGGAGAAEVVTDASTARTLALADAGKYIRMTSGSTNSVEVPPNSLEAFPIDTEVHIRQAGAGSTAFAAGAGVTLHGGLTLTGQHATATVKKVATDTWDVFGSVE